MDNSQSPFVIKKYMHESKNEIVIRVYLDDKYFEFFIDQDNSMHSNSNKLIQEQIEICKQKLTELK